MPSAAYFRRQADICLRLSLVSSDDAASTRLVAMAKEYLAACEAVEQQASVRGTPRETTHSGAIPRRDPVPDERTRERHRLGSNR